MESSHELIWIWYLFQFFLSTLLTVQIPGFSFQKALNGGRLLQELLQFTHQPRSIQSDNWDMKWEIVLLTIFSVKGKMKDQSSFTRMELCCMLYASKSFIRTLLSRLSEVLTTLHRRNKKASPSYRRILIYLEMHRKSKDSFPLRGFFSISLWSYFHLTKASRSPAIIDFYFYMGF